MNIQKTPAEVDALLEMITGLWPDTPDYEVRYFEGILKQSPCPALTLERAVREVKGDDRNRQPPYKRLRSAIKRANDEHLAQASSMTLTPIQRARGVWNQTIETYGPPETFEAVCRIVEEQVVPALRVEYPVGDTTSDGEKMDRDETADRQACLIAGIDPMNYRAVIDARIWGWLQTRTPGEDPVPESIVQKMIDEHDVSWSWPQTRPDLAEAPEEAPSAPLARSA